MGYGPYNVKAVSLSVSAAKTIIQVAVPTNSSILVLGWELTQDASVTSDQLLVQLIKTTTAATVTSATPTLVASAGQSASSCVGGAALTGTNATVEGGTITVIHSKAFNALQGAEWWAVDPVRDGIPVVGGGFVALKLNDTPLGATVFDATVHYWEFN